MKKQIILIISLLLVVISFNSCTLLYYATPTNDIYSPNYQGEIYSKWKAEQALILQNQLNYANSAEFKRQYGGGVPNTTNGPDAKSVIGTNADPLGAIRNSTIILDRPVQVEIRPIKY